MSDYTLIASKRSTRLLHTLFGLQWFGVSDSNLTVNYVMFGSDNQKLVGNRNGRYDVAAAPCSRTSILHVQLLHFCQLLSNPSIDLELQYIFGKPMKCGFQQCTVRMEILSTFHAWVKYICYKIRHWNHSANGDKRPENPPFLLRHVDMNALVHPTHHPKQ